MRRLLQLILENLNWVHAKELVFEHAYLLLGIPTELGVLSTLLGSITAGLDLVLLLGVLHPVDKRLLDEDLAAVEDQ